MNSQKIIFLTIGEPGYSRSWTYFNGARKLGADVEFLKVKPQNLSKQFLALSKILSKDYVYVVMSPSQYLVPYVRIFLGKKIILDAGWSLFEATVISRRKFGLFGLKAIKIYLIDFISSIMAKKIILESQSQILYYSRIFKIKKSKCHVIYTGLDEDQFKLKKRNEQNKKLKSKYKVVLFKGKYNNESGLEVLAKTSKMLKNEKIQFWIFAPGLPKNISFGKNVYVCKKNLKQIEMITIQQRCDLALGQMAKNKRLNRTIPHKAFEFAYLAKPYLSGRNLAIKELFVENVEILCFEPGNPKDLAEKIKSILDDDIYRLELARNFQRAYFEKCSQYSLSKKFLDLANEQLD